jgi:hypothetical protein
LDPVRVISDAMVWLLKGRDKLLKQLCADCFEADEPIPAGDDADGSHETTSATPSPEADPEGTAALLLIAQDAVADERERGRALDTKAASLVGATGLILSLNVTLGRPLLSEHFGPIGRWLVRLSFLLAVVALLLALLVGIIGVLAPQEYRGLRRRQIRAFNSEETQAMSRLHVHIAMLGALDAILHQDRPVNDCKARLTSMVAFLLAVGFIGVAGEALTLVANKMGL